MNNAHADWNGGKNDGFVLQYEVRYGTGVNPAIPMGYDTRATLPVLYSLAGTFTVCDRRFGSVLSSTWPKRKYLHSGKRDQDNVWYKFAAYHAVTNFTHVAEFVTDCREDRLPTVSIVDPAFTLADGHPAHNPQLGQKFIGLIVDALTHSESWRNSALVILYDENCGFYDHVAPAAAFETPPGEDTPLGFRVPAIVISPYPKARVCRAVFDHTAIMKSINVRWGGDFGDEFGPRWKNAPDIWSECCDFAKAALPVGLYTGKPITDITWGTGIYDRVTKTPDILEGFLERIFILPELKALDRRAQVFDTLVALEQSVISLKRTING